MKKIRWCCFLRPIGSCLNVLKAPIFAGVQSRRAFGREVAAEFISGRYGSACKEAWGNLRVSLLGNLWARLGSGAAEQWYRPGIPFILYKTALQWINKVKTTGFINNSYNSVIMYFTFKNGSWKLLCAEIHSRDWSTGTVTKEVVID